MDKYTHRGIICWQKMQISYWSAHHAHEPEQVQVDLEEQLMGQYHIIHVVRPLR